MRIGVVREIKAQENRVALTPAGAKELIGHGHSVRVEQNAGLGAGFHDEEYRAAGAGIVSAESAWDCELVLKVKEPLPDEFRYFNGQMLFTYLHLAGTPAASTKALVKGRITAIAYETIENAVGGFPLLAPMSAIAGNMAVAVGNHYLARHNGGKGVQLGRVLGRRNGKVMVIGDGTVGSHAAHTADGMGANVLMLGRNGKRRAAIRKMVSGNLQFIPSSTENIRAHLPDIDLLIGAVLLPGDRAPHLVSEEMVRTMQPGSVIVDVSIDQGGCIETARVTTHADPVYECHGVIHYGVSNMPGAYPRTATLALTDATLPYICRLADNGIQALRDDPLFAKGVNLHQGMITCQPVAHAHKLDSLYQVFR